VPAAALFHRVPAGYKDRTVPTIQAIPLTYPTLRRSIVAAIIVLAVCTAAAWSPTQSPPQSALGHWSMQAEWVNGTSAVSVVVTEVDGDLAVAWEGRQGKLDGKEVAFADGVLSFTLEVESQNSESIDLRFEGVIKGDRIDGKLVLPNGAEMKVDGRRVTSG